jgi:hypothetical protein
MNKRQSHAHTILEILRRERRRIGAARVVLAAPAEPGATRDDIDPPKRCAGGVNDQ